MNHIELFAGCGGLSLGLETAGFKLLFANELSPMASESFAYNHLNTDLTSDSDPANVFWVSSMHDRNSIKSRLRENPYDAIGLQEQHFSDLLDIKPTNEQLNRSLLVGSIVDVNKILDAGNTSLLEQFRTALGQGEVDLVSGGPPCQSFSLAGMRDHTHHRNELPWEFAKFVEKIKPKMTMLENVSGILRAFKIDGEQYYAWFEVAKAFAKVGYIPLCLHVNAKYAGVAQNRPRFILLAFREDIALILSNKLDSEFKSALKKSIDFYQSIKSGEELPYGSLKCFDIEKDSGLFEDSILSSLYSNDKKLPTVKDALDDLRSENIGESKYVSKINNTYINYHDHRLNKQKNHELRANNPKVKARFRLYQILSRIDKVSSKEIVRYLKTSGAEPISTSTLSKLTGYWLLDLTGGEIKKPTKEQVITILSGLYTKKQTQKALVEGQPAPAALSIPDDACHYHQSIESQRTLTVREMARIQSFPDWFEVRSKVTTGGQMRKFEVPQYTQIGNAVPPLLGLALGNICRELLILAE
ncbi:DNA (cytosine-5-)-methyltransferase [Pseudoalteromonas luteoviolacea]|uniref:DNA cytosine methyltransferase n=1 Tax=Pseudoalteromonas luteoviolacea TaxID=43657 RepID=UPI001B3748E6|nr:DNA (cytosine-5-)-methyltransferase [Pseudoalteromonas luteoviolacea]MBQ4811763.1 DNA (cytosine-5-)-methyltransferase [Pseudoalteromonas luteoviolacea]